MLLTMFLFQKWLGSPFPEDVWAWWLLMHWLQLQFTPCEALPSVWIGLAWQYSQACCHLCCLCTFSYTISSFQSTLPLICFYTALLEQPPLSVMTLCDLPSLWRVSMIAWNIAKSAVFLIIVVSKNKWYPQCMDGHLLKLKCKYSNILRYCIFDFHELYALIIQIKTKKLLKCFTLNVMNLNNIKNITLWNKLQEKINFFMIFIFFLCTCIFKYITFLNGFIVIIFNLFVHSFILFILRYCIQIVLICNFSWINSLTSVCLLIVSVPTRTHTCL